LEALCCTACVWKDPRRTKPSKDAIKGILEPKKNISTAPNMAELIRVFVPIENVLINGHAGSEYEELRLNESLWSGGRGPLGTGIAEGET